MKPEADQDATRFTSIWFVEQDDFCGAKDQDDWGLVSPEHLI